MARMVLISPSNLEELIRDAPAVLIDTRDPGQFVEGHIARNSERARGVHLPCDFIAGWAQRAWRQVCRGGRECTPVRRAKPVIIYCFQGRTGVQHVPRA
jgi:rhodanese-related sulfurtransferase